MNEARPSPLRLTAAEVQDVIRRGLPTAARSGLAVEEVRENYARVRIPFHPWMLRPGELVSGPALFSAADSAMFACVLAHIGPEVMAVTASLNIHFLNPAPVGDIVAECRLLKLGQRLAFMEVSLHTGDPDTPVAHVTGTYALPRVKRK